MSLKNPVTPPGIDPGTVRLEVQRLKLYATPDPYILIELTQNSSNEECNPAVLLIVQQLNQFCLTFLRPCIMN